MGEVADPDGVGEVKHEGGGCFDTVRLTVKLDDGVISEAKFRARACSGTIAACSVLCEMLAGMDVDEARQLTEQVLIDRLGGIPDKKLHSVELAVEAVRKALNMGS